MPFFRRASKVAPAYEAHTLQDAEPSKAISELLKPITQDALPAMKEPINSSGQRPSSAAAHNLMWQRKEHNRLHLLNLPHRLRLAIFRLVLTIRDHSPVQIRAEQKELSAEPALLQTCHALREIYRPVFYKENRFVVHVEQYGIHAVLPWLDRHGILAFTTADSSVLDAQPGEEFQVAVAPAVGHSSEFSNAEAIDGDFWEKAVRLLGQRWETLTTPASPAAPSKSRGECIIRTDGVPNWTNLVSWLQLSHSGHVVALMRGDASGKEEEEGEEAPPILAAFEMVMTLGDETWATVEKILPGIRSMLVAGDARWGSSLALTVAGEEDVNMSDGEEGHVQSMAEIQHAAAIESGAEASQTTGEYFSPEADEQSPNEEDHYQDEVLEAEDSYPDLPSPPQLKRPRAPFRYQHHPTRPSSSQQTPQRKASVRSPRGDVEVMDLTQGAPAQIDLSHDTTEYERFAQVRKRRVAKNKDDYDLKGSDAKKRKTDVLIEDSDSE
ncbi:hypothetical protein KC340_g16222 [Hortaea werneckii]|nr:hypothetical protein KC342_g16521 [Hortaea werneckii]KAI7071312.1 hypothetical protein KC339_g14468 [Hortaea werneckii]KAI7224661.1 hypothetical protein KC365_g10518 [Hortaea werneckii]KAI7294254.1 hypothetical protein KC340_g16222 [Hortaea werneckii]KAI7389087.1 hypothetical protein KC328_g8620 [Hortaea werneckii]